MAAIESFITSYGLTVGEVLTIEPMIKQLDPDDLPLQNGATYGGLSPLPTMPITNKKFEWQDDTRLLPLSTLNEGATLTASDVTVTVTDGDRFVAGDLVKVDNEEMYVTAVSGNDLTVTRGAAGTTAATHADGSTIFGVGQMLPENSVPVKAKHVDRTRRYNVTQIFGPREVGVSGTELMIPKYGLPVGGEYNYQIAKEAVELATHFEMALAFGQRYDDGSDQRSMGGLDYYIQSHVDSTTTSLSRSSIEALLQKMYNSGSSPGQTWELWTSMANKLAIDQEDVTSIRLTREDTGRGQVVDYIDTSLGRVSLGVSRHYPDSVAHIISREDIAYGFLRPWSVTPLAKTRDGESVMLVAEGSMKVEAERHHAKMTALAP